MEESTKKVPAILTLGILFNYVVNATKDKYNVTVQSGVGKRNSIKEADVMQALIEIFKPSHPKTLATTMTANTSQFKSCEIDGSDWIPFDKDIFIQEFNESFDNDYNILLSRTNSFFSEYIDITNRLKPLIMTLLSFLTVDNTLNKEDELYLLNNKQAIAIKDIKPDKKYEADIVFLGVFHFLINLKRKNTEAKQTLKGIYKQTTKHTKKSFRGFFRGKFESTPIILRALTDEKYSLSPSTFNNPSPESNVYDNYLIKAKDKYSSLKTLLYTASPRNFYDFYVCNRLSVEGHFSFDYYLVFQDEEDGIKDSTVQKLLGKISNFIIISGTGGLGKSMMMRHLLLSSINDYPKTKNLPVFIPLKEFSNKYKDLIEFAYEKIKSLSDVSIDEFKQNIINGNVIFLLDGLDEINSEYLPLFQRQIEYMTDKYSANTYIISTRPSDDFINYSRFSVTDLLPFNKSQAIELIEKLDFRPDVPEIKEKFLVKLKKDLFITHNEFTRNPLLLTIMLMTFETYGNVPSKMHKFYFEAYETLADKHDSTKAYNRPMKTKLDKDTMKEYLEEFSMLTYYDEQFEFSKEQVESYFSRLKTRKKHPQHSFTSSDFLSDLVHGVCLLYREGGKYHFVHRSFQEYFCACYFAKQKDKVLERIGDFFANKKQRISGDKTFDMLIDMIPEKTEEYIFLPFLEKKLKPILDSENSFFNFLKEFFPVIEYSTGEVSYKKFVSTESVILRKILHFIGIYGIFLTNMPHEEDFADDWFITVYDAQDTNKEHPEIMRLIDLVGPDDSGDPINPEDATGWAERIDINDICCEDYPESYKALQNSELKDAYNKLVEYYHSLKKKTSTEDKDDLLSYFE